MSPITRADTLLTDAVIRRETEAGHWPVPTVPDLFAANARECPEREAYVDEHERVTWGELHDRATRVAAALLSMGVEPGDVVAVQIPNRVAFVVAMVAINQVGAIVCPCDVTLRESELRFVLRFSGAVAAFVVADDPRYDHLAAVQRLAPDLPALREVIAVGTARDGAEPARTFGSLLARAAGASDRARLAARAPSAHDLCRLLFTSGSTGDPKGVLHTHATTVYGNYRQNAHTDVTEESVILVCIPAALNWGMFQLLQGAIARCRVVLLERFDPARVLDLTEREGITTLGAPPTALIALLEQPGLEDRDLNTLGLITTSGAACPIELLRRAHARLGCVVMEAYGMTEVGWISAADPSEPVEETVGTVGRPHPWMGVRLADDDGHEVAPGEEGEVLIGGPCVCVGYYGNPERNAATFTADGAFRTGDVGRIDDDGRLRLVGRTKDLIKHGGASVFPREIEELLYAHPKVLEVAVVGVPDEYFGENACACVVPRAGESLELDDIVGFLRGRIATYKLPQRLELLDELPYTPTGKVQKQRLRELVMSRPTQESAAVPTARR